MPKAAAGGGRKRKANGYELPDPLPLGETLKDVGKKEWCLGPTIGKGGFGEIYSACEAGAKSKLYPYAIKIEPHSNGPLFVERSFYIKVCKPESLEDWKKKRGLKILGLPSLQGFGSHVHNSKNYRFVVMDRFGADLWALFLNSNKLFTPYSVFTYAIQILDALEYIHSMGYVHCDVKGANLLFGYNKGTENNLFLVDFGLACKYSTDKEFKRDPRKAHNGTIEYTSRDMHQGVATRRGDLELLGFNLIHWLCSKLPWEKLISDQEKVFQSKNDFMSSIKSKLKALSSNIPQVIVDYMEYVSKLGHVEEPDYKKCRDLFEKALKGLPKDSKGKRAVSKSPKKRGRTARDKAKQENNSSDSEGDQCNGNVEENESPAKKQKTTSKAKGDWRSAPACEPGPLPKFRSKTARNQVKTEPDSTSNPVTLKSNKAASSSNSKPSWKDCPTIKASNIQVAGEYNKKTKSKK